ncbi:ECF transporter S component [Petroclostridium sp. X23]|uniref:ECF transporter S component n=1 Tax=Petroclostridium sp. X23 TaxID=3045146 RepID=UPI0024AE4128|nr:ECF transporter S component [Petroclostridium sp. X23]WHH61193.1 ECF transporter S component [Petroclostridium sp. X23]
MNSKIRNLAYAGLMTALVFIATGLLPRIPISGTGGYIHIGDSMIFIAAILLGWKHGAAVGGIGSALADIYLGYTVYALPTLIIKGIMGAIVGFMAHDAKDAKTLYLKNFFSVVFSGAWIALGISLHRLLQGIASSKIASSIIEQLELSGPEELSKLAANIQTVLMGTIIAIPVILMILSTVLHKKDRHLFSINSLIGMTLGGLIMVVGYYFAEGILVGNMITPIFSIHYNILQFVGGTVIAFALLIPLKQTGLFK